MKHFIYFEEAHKVIWHYVLTDIFSGRIWNRRRAGGDPKRLRVVDTTRTDLDGEPRVERVLFIIEDQVRSAHLAAVAGGDRKRYILATENMLSGDLITTSCVLTDIPGEPLWKDCRVESHIHVTLITYIK